MPYINQQARNDLKGGHPPKTAGELNFLFCMVILGKLGQKSFPKEAWLPTFVSMMKQYVDVNGLSYQHINDAYGAAHAAAREICDRTEGDYLFARQYLVGAADKFYTEVARPYENQKIVENGDVF